MSERKVELYDEPNKYAEPARLSLGEIAEVGGYQKFLLGDNFVEVNPEDQKLLRKKEALTQLFESQWFDHKSILDLGAGAGFFCFHGVLKGAPQATALDIDKEYLNIIQKIKDKFGYSNVRIDKQNILDYEEPADLVLAFALVHWIYSCAADYGSLSKAVEKLASLTNEILIVEWIEPSDEAIQSFKRLEYNEEAITEPYNKEEFEEALKKNFVAFKKIGEISPTRCLYAAVKKEEIVGEIQKPKQTINLWEIFSLLNEKKIPYVALRNWELISDQADVYGDMILEAALDENALETLDLYCGNYAEKRTDKLVEYRIPIDIKQGGLNFLNFNVFKLGTGFFPEEFEKRLINSRQRYKNIFGLPALELQLFILYETVYYLGAAVNQYANIAAVLGEYTGIKIRQTQLRDFSRICEILRKNALKIDDYNKIICDESFPFIHPPEEAVSSRVLDTIDGKTYISRVYKLDDKIVKQTNHNLAEREYNILKELDSEYFPKVFNFKSEDSHFEEELIEGYRLDEAHKFYKENDEESYKKFVLHCLELLDELDANDIIHRDITAENIIVRNGKPVLTDFGWAKKRGEDFVTPPGLNNPNLPNDGERCNFYAMGKVLDKLDNLYYSFPELTATLLEENSQKRIKDGERLKEIYEKDVSDAYDEPPVTIIVPTFNNLELTKKCFAALYQTTKFGSFKLIAIDNGSTDGTKDYLEDLSTFHENFDYIINGENLGFAKANNQGIERSGSEYLLFLSDDCEPTSGWLDKLLLEAKKHKDAGIIGALLLYPNSSLIQHCGVQVGLSDGKKLFYYKNRYRKLENVPEARINGEEECVTAACMFVRQKLIDEIGAFDEEFKNGYVDIDFCLRAKKAGYKIRYCGESVVYHHESQTEGRDDKNEENYSRLINKWGDEIKPLEPEHRTAVNLMDQWLRGDLLKNPDDRDKIKELLKIAKIRDCKAEIEEFERALKQKPQEPTKPKAKTKASVIALALNNLEYTKKCVDRLYKNTTEDFELIIVDNGSSDGTREWLERKSEELDNVKPIYNEKNLGFAKGCNQAAAKAESEFLVFLNNDAEPEAGWLDAALKRFESDESIGVVGAKLLYPDRTIQHCGIEFQREKGKYEILPQHRYRHVLESDPRVNEAEEVQAVTGAFFVIPSRLFEQIGGFDESYPLYFEDTDLCFKAREAGKKIYYEPECVAIHHEGKTLDDQEKINELNIESAKTFFAKWSARLARIHLETFVEKTEGGFVYLSREIIPNYKDKIAVNQFINIFHNFGDFYFHVGGAGDALLLLSSFYDESPESVVVSLPDSLKTMENFFKVFPKLKNVYFIQWDNEYLIEAFLRSTFPKFKNFLGMGATPENLDNDAEWNEKLDIFQRYNIKPNPKWTAEFTSEKIEDPQVVLAPTGSLKGTPKCKKNWISPEYWKNTLDYLENEEIKPIVIGTPEEEDDFPIHENCIDKRGYDFDEQMQLIASADICVACDSWHKTFAALAEVKTIVYRSERSPEAASAPDSSEHVFIKPWKEITSVDTFEDFVAAWENSIEETPINENPNLTSFSSHFWNRGYDKARTVFIKCPDSIGDALMISAVISELKKKYPHLLITVSGSDTVAEILASHPQIEDFVLALSSDEFANEAISDVAIDYNDIMRLLPEYFGVLRYKDIIGNIAGIKLDDFEFVYEIAENESEWADEEVSQYFGEIPEGKLIGLHLLTKNDPLRLYPKGEELINELLKIDDEFKLIAFGSEPLAKGEPEVYGCAEKEIQLRKQIALASKCDAFIVIDRAFLHIAHKLLGKPTLAILGPTNPALIGDGKVDFEYIRNEELDCLSCYWSRECKVECMTELSPKTIADRFIQTTKPKNNINKVNVE